MCKGNRCTPVTLEPADHIPESATGTLWHLFAIAPLIYRRVCPEGALSQ